MDLSLFVALLLIGGLLAVSVWYVNSLRSSAGDHSKVVHDSELQFEDRFMHNAASSEESDVLEPPSEHALVAEHRVVEIGDDLSPLDAMQKMIDDSSADVQDLFIIGNTDKNTRDRLVEEMKNHTSCAVGVMGYNVEKTRLVPAEHKCDVLDMSHPVAFRRGFFSTDFELPEHDIDLSIWVSSYLRDRFVKKRCFTSGEYYGDVQASLDELWQT